ncbi:MAG: FmdB family transcriptional regulator [Chloroflexi bacterium]|nr:FmdB family transcriptional regulator [Chloroflexota bacterium]|tara:strand:- start:3878 stop:4165 length:288 start_codon:yes stop_codon:yes gene_type:complete
MPIYEYKCLNKNCDTEIFEIIQNFSDKPIAKCPDCVKNGERIISAFSVHFKGSGWYSTSNRSSTSQVKSKSTKNNSKSDNKSVKKNKSSKSKKPE